MTATVHSFSEAQQAYQDAKARNDSRDIHRTSKALCEARTAELKAILAKKPEPEPSKARMSAWEWLMSFLFFAGAS